MGAAQAKHQGTGPEHAPNEPGTLYVVATPIGNLGDITQRALDTLRRVRLIAAEDTRHTGLLLQHFGIHARLISFHAHNTRARLPRILSTLSEGDVALVSDAGTPLISDPGQELVSAAIEAGFAVFPIPGASAPIAALSVSGLSADTFHFLGFLPRRTGERAARLSLAQPWPGAVVLLEAPHRLRATLADLRAAWGDRRVAVCCELTKLFEQVFRGSLGEAIDYYAHHEPRGEFTLVLEGARGSESAAAAATLTATSPAERRQRFEALAAGLGDRKLALAALAKETGLPRKVLYRELRARSPR